MYKFLITEQYGSSVCSIKTVNNGNRSKHTTFSFPRTVFTKYAITILLINDVITFAKSPITRISQSLVYFARELIGFINIIAVAVGFPPTPLVPCPFKMSAISYRFNVLISTGNKNIHFTNLLRLVRLMFYPNSNTALWKKTCVFFYKILRLFRGERSKSNSIRPLSSIVLMLCVRF